MRFYFTIRIDIKKQIDKSTLTDFLVDAIVDKCREKDMGLVGGFLSCVKVPQMVKAIDTIVDYAKNTTYFNH